MPLTKGQKIASQRNLANARECISISIPLPPPFLLLTHSPHQLPQPCRTLQGRAKQRAAKFAESLGDGGPPGMYRAKGIPTSRTTYRRFPGNRPPRRAVPVRNDQRALLARLMRRCACRAQVVVVTAATKSARPGSRPIIIHNTLITYTLWHGRLLALA